MRCEIKKKQKENNYVRNVKNHMGVISLGAIPPILYFKAKQKIQTIIL